MAPALASAAALIEVSACSFTDRRADFVSRRPSAESDSSRWQTDHVDRRHEVRIRHGFVDQTGCLRLGCRHAFPEIEDGPGAPQADLCGEEVGSTDEYTLALINQASLPVLMRHFDAMETQAQHRLGKRRRELEKLVIDMVRQGIVEGALHKAHPEIATLTAFGASNWVYVWYSPEGPLSEAEVAEVLADQVVRGFL